MAGGIAGWPGRGKGRESGRAAVAHDAGTGGRGAGLPGVRPTLGKPFRLKDHPLSDDVLGGAATAEEAVALAVRHFPAGLGPAVRGATGQLA
ncbi:DUF6193 family natural product biosynthesis protein [Streptomyces hydrogenans]|uniref:DUF6193 family natural product biosynthesis protein n=1 Tax=Streptomyces hydrogenans TaxID=1873719 RepID=UPI003425EC83